LKSGKKIHAALIRIRRRETDAAHAVLSKRVSAALFASAGLLPDGNTDGSPKPFPISSFEQYLPNRGVRPHIKIPSHILSLIIGNQRLSRRWNRSEIGAKPSARFRVQQIMELAQLGF